MLCFTLLPSFSLKHFRLFPVCVYLSVVTISFPFSGSISYSLFTGTATPPEINLTKRFPCRAFQQLYHRFVRDPTFCAFCSFQTNRSVSKQLIRIQSYVFCFCNKATFIFPNLTNGNCFSCWYSSKLTFLLSKNTGLSFYNLCLKFFYICLVFYL